MNSRIDHIVIGAANLISGTKILETKLSTKFSPGGDHQIMGTHNKLLKLIPFLENLLRRVLNLIQLN